MFLKTKFEIILLLPIHFFVSFDFEAQPSRSRLKIERNSVKTILKQTKSYDLFEVFEKTDSKLTDLNRKTLLIDSSDEYLPLITWLILIAILKI